MAIDSDHKIDISIIIVNYNAEIFLINCIESIYKNSNNLKIQIIVVDNNSKDNSRITTQGKYPDVIWIQNFINRGFATANNQAIKQSKGKFIMLLNNDTIILNNALNKLLNYIESDSTIGAVGPRILNKDGSLQASCRRGLPNAINSVGYFTKLYKIFPKSKKLGSYAMSYISDKQSHEVEAVSGAAMLIKSEVIKKIGGLDENYFMHFEDIDLCLRISLEGYKLFYVHDAEIIHFKGQSSKLRSKKVIEDFHNSLLYYYKKNYSNKKNFITNFFAYFIIKLRKRLCLALYRMKN